MKGHRDISMHVSLAKDELARDLLVIMWNNNIEMSSRK